MNRSIMMAVVAFAGIAASSCAAPLLVVVDVRRDEEYNGWRLRGEPRGGHVPGAVQLPVEWLTQGDGSPRPADEVRAVLEKHGLSTRYQLVVAGTGAERTARAVTALRAAGASHVTELEGGLESYLGDASKPLERLPGYATLVPPAWLDAAQRGRAVEAPPQGRVVVLEVSWGSPKDRYDSGHIPGALHLDTNEIEKDTAVTPRGCWRLVPLPELRAAFGKLGVGPDTTLVVYSDPNFAAARAGWAAVYAGVRDVRLLNGGLRAWKADGLPVETRAASTPLARRFDPSTKVREDVRHGNAWVREHLHDRGQAICDIRSWNEYLGLSSGYDDVPHRGRVPGAIWVRGGADPHSLTGDYEDEDGTLRSYTAVAAMWREQGVPENTPMTFYCGTGWRASVGWFFAETMGRPSPAVMDSGWVDWSMGPDAAINPVARGLK